MNKKKEELNARYTMLMWAFAAVAVGCAICLLGHYFKRYQNEQVYEQLREKKVTEEVKKEQKKEPKKEEKKEEKIEEEPLVYCEPLYDMNELRQQNEDIYAWVTVPQTGIDYPVLQTETDNYYLDRNLDGTQGYPGSIYTNKCNSKDFTDGNTIAYGHNMKDGTMFMGLHKFAEEAFFNENDTIIVYADDRRLTYQIYAAVKFSDAYIPAQYDISKPEGTKDFLTAIQDAKEDTVSHIREDMEVKPEDRLITLSTCVAGEDDKRYIVVGKLMEEAFYRESAE